MGSEGVGECSRRTDSDNSGDDGSMDSERPLKKARYVWQVKGKYHLKDSLNSTSKDSSDSSEGCSTTTGNVQNNDEIIVEKENSSSIVNNNGCNNNNNNNNTSCNGRCCIEALLAQSEMVMTNDESSDEEHPHRNADKSVTDETPVTLVKPNPKIQDYFLNRWQARQVAKGYLDNTINRVLESWMVAPAFDTADFVENCDNDGQIEDEGILMAIQSHGLQSGPENWGESSSNRHRNDGDNSVPFPAPEEIDESAMDNYQNVHNEFLKKQSSESGPPNNEPEGELENIEMGDHTNFLDAAVSVAIQKKGLTSQNYV